MQVGLVENFWVTGTRSRRQQVGWSHPLSAGHFWWAGAGWGVVQVEDGKTKAVLC